MRVLRFVLLFWLAIDFLGGTSVGLLRFSPAMAAQDIKVNTGSKSPYVVIGNNLAWGSSGQGGVNNYFLFTPISPDQRYCLFLKNNNPSNQHTLTLTSWQTGNPAETAFNNNASGNWVQDTVQGSPSPVPAGSTVVVYVHANAAAYIAVSITGTSSAGGSPDTANIWLVQTQAESCGPTGSGAQYVQGAVPSGTTASPNPTVGGGMSNDGLGKVVADVNALSNGGKTVVNVSHGYNPFAAQNATGQTAAFNWLSTTTTAGHIPLWMTFQVVTTGGPATCTLNVQGSLDNINWFDLSGNQTCTSSLMFHVVNKPVQYVRINLSALTGGTSPTVTTTVFGEK